MVKAFCWDIEISNRLNRVAGNLSTLALQAFASPFCDVLFHRWPNKFCCYGGLRAVDSWVAQAVDHIEYTSSPCYWHKRTRRAIRDVDNDAASFQLALFEVEARTCIRGDASVVGVERLIPRHFFKVNTHGAD